MSIIYDPDLVAFSGLRDVRNFVGASVDTLINQIAASKLAAGWTQLDTGTSSGHPFFQMLSQQSPWVAGGATPGDYSGKVKAYIHAIDATYCRIRGSSADDSLIQTPADAEIALQKDAVNPYRIISCPYQSVYYTPGVIDTLPRAGIISAPHTPSFLQLGFGLRECIVSMRANVLRRNLYGGGTDPAFLAIKDNAGTFAWTSGSDDNGRPQFEVPFAGGMVKQNAVRVANMIDDPTFLNPAVWYPLYSPAMMMWSRNGGGVGPEAIKCWPWDSLILSQWFPDSYMLITADGHTFVPFTHLNDLTQNGVPGTWFICTDGPT